ncbi:hypothetical protein, partial [Parachlamydia acanthamoebae]
TIMFLLTPQYTDFYPDFTRTTDKIDESDKVVQTLHEFDADKELLGIKKDKKTQSQSLVHINKDDYTIKNRILSWFGKGKLAHTKFDLYDVCRYLWHYDFQVEDKEVHKKVCDIAGKFLLRPGMSLYKRAAYKYAQSPEQLATLALWIKNSKKEDAPIYFETDARKFTLYTNSAMEDSDSSVNSEKVKKVFRNLCIWSSPK